MRALVFLLLVAVASAKMYERCELARALKADGMDGHGTSLSGWVCLAYHESRFHTDAKNSANSDGSTDYGIFQINNRWWCTDGKWNNNGCGISCSALSNLQTSIRCAKHIVNNHHTGIRAWVAWVNHCQGDTSSYIKGCKL
ncbi:hypothetical protein ACEWY4_004639 [Coilia grayii]|uniref:lysozyme n=1 Tax=Coilia grayii TaxID=363190 RepID=A0ABD1KM36_9TELE